ncbi:MAG: AGE family epimerase/isomerase, partial [Gammaproteobacteria bacterium]|nr:AGE family epimerase/isomerase [Gammaproteobacteria bacterium]
ILGDDNLLRKIKPICIRIVDTCLQEGSGGKGELVDGFDFTKNETVTEHIWWVQAEALVGYLNAYQLSSDAKYISAFESTWEFIKKYQKNSQYGEWHWFSKLDLHEKQQQYKAGFWKAPYHNGRAMMEVCDRFKKMAKKIDLDVA